tara:strand:+ start:31 stop:303 length:273 start_codon:yes stop_codon:yes gene_type:complete
MKTIRIYITGMVQGVFFRKFLEEKANELGIRGFCRNLEDGRVEIAIEGKDDNIGEMLGICEKGTQHTDITDVQVQELPHQGFEGFKIMKL